MPDKKIDRIPKDSSERKISDITSQDSSEQKKSDRIPQDSSQQKRTLLQFLTEHRLDFILFGFIVICLTPIFSVWYYGDDTSTRDIFIFMRQENRNLFQYIVNQMNYYIIKVGRFFPVHLCQRFLTFYIFNSLEKYRLYVVGMNALAIFSFASMVRIYSGSKKTYYAIMLLFPGIFLFLTRYDDAVTSYFMFIQTLVIYLACSLICFKVYLEKKKTFLLVAGLFLFLLSLLSYESSYLLVLVYPLAAFFLSCGSWKERILSALRKSLSFFVVAFLCFAVYVYFSINATTDYQGISFNLELGAILSTFMKQIAAALPIVPHLWLLQNPDWNSTLNSITMMDITTTTIFLCLLAFCFCKEETPVGKEEATAHKSGMSSRGRWFLMWLSVLLIICPTLLISISVKYQQSLTWGTGYLTIYITRFGFLLLGYLAYEWVISRMKKQTWATLLNLLLCLCFAVISLFSQQGNRHVLDYKNQTSYLRVMAEQSFEAGILENIPDNSVVLLGNMWYGYPSFTRDKILSDMLNKKVTTITLLEYQQALKEGAEELKMMIQNPNVYYFHFEKFLSNRGFSFCGKLDRSSFDGINLVGLFAKDFKIFYNGDECGMVNIAVKEENTFVQKRYSLYSCGFKSYMATVHGLVDLRTVELINHLNTEIWGIIE